MDMSIPSRCDFLQRHAGIEGVSGMRMVEGVEKLQQGGEIDCGLRLGRNKEGVVATATFIELLWLVRGWYIGILCIFEDGNEGDASSALGGAEGGRF